MTSIVQAGVDGLGLSKGQHRTVFRNPRGLKYYYSFYVYAPIGVQEVYYKASADGRLWGGSVSALTRGDGSDVWNSFDVKIHDDGSQLEVWIVGVCDSGSSGNYETLYRYGTIADAASTISWSTLQTIDANIETLLSDPHCIALARTDNGEIVVAFTEDFVYKGKDYRYTKLIGSDGDGAAPSWSGETTWDDPSGSTNNQNKGEVWFGLESFSSSYPDDFFIYASVPVPTTTTSYEVSTAVPDWDQGGAGFTNTTIAEWRTNSVSLPMSGIIDESDIAHFCYGYQGATSAESRKAGTAGDDDLGLPTTFSADTIDALTVSIDTGPATDLLYVFYKNSADSVDWNYKTSPVDTISWSDEQTVSYHQDTTALTSWNRVIENSLHIGGLYDTTAIYNEHPVYKALSTTLADLEFPDQNYYLGPHST